MPSALRRSSLKWWSSSAATCGTPRSRARSMWRRSICSITGSHSPVSAFASSCSRRSVMPESAECTTTGCSPSASRSRTTAATFFQLLTLETLVPPNFRTTHELSTVIGTIPNRRLVQNRRLHACLTVRRSPDAHWPPCQEPGTRAAAERLLVFVVVLQFLLQAFFGEHVL